MWAASPATNRRARLHRFDHPASHRRDPDIEDLAWLQRGLTESGLEFRPDPVLGPPAEVLVWSHLQVQAADLRRSHAGQGEAISVVGVDQLLARRPGSGEDAQPRVGVFTLVGGDLSERQPSNAMGAVTGGDSIRSQLVRFTVPLVGDQPLVGFHRFHLSLELNPAAGFQPSLDEVFHNLLLPIDGDRFAGQFFEVDPVTLAGELQG